MPLPLVPVVIGLGAAAGLWGTGKAARAVSESRRAGVINGAAEQTIESSKQRVEDAREACQQTLEELGRKKADAVALTLQHFIDAYSQLKNVEVDQSRLLDGPISGQIEGHALEEMRSDVRMIEAAGLGLGAGASSGSLIAFGAYKGTMLLATAGTGTAIASLKGVAATNATLAWLGGGSLAAGGMGVAGGLMVLGSVAAGPALLVFGSVLGKRAEAKLNDAYANKERALTFAKESEAATSKLEGLVNVASELTSTLSAARTVSRRLSNALGTLVEQNGSDYRSFSTADRELVFKAVKAAQLVKLLIDTPVLDKDGNLLGDAQANIRTGGELLPKLKARSLH